MATTDFEEIIKSTFAASPTASSASTATSSTSKTNTLTSVPTTNGSTEFIGHPEPTSNSSTIIAVGVTVPLFLLIVITGFLFYKWYRRKYPVRMIIGRDFGKFENPDYQNKLSTLTLVRDDAEDFFTQASKNSSAVSLNTLGGHDNLAFVKDKNYNPSDDGDIVKRKSFLFKALDDNMDWMEMETETEFTSTSSQSTVLDSSRDLIPVSPESDKNLEHYNNNTKSAKEPNHVHLSQEELHNIKNAREHFQKESSVEIMPTYVKRKRAATQDETQERQFTYGNAKSARFRSKSADPMPLGPINGQILSKDSLMKSRNSGSFSDSSRSTENNNVRVMRRSDISDDYVDFNTETAVETKLGDEVRTGGFYVDNTSSGGVKFDERSSHSSVSDDSENKDALLLANAEFSDNNSVCDIPLRVKNDSESLASIRGESGSNNSRSSSSASANFKNAVISPDASFVVLPSTEVSDESSEIVCVDNVESHEPSANDIVDLERLDEYSHNANHRHPSNTDSSPKSGASNHFSKDVKRKKKKKKRVITHDSASSASDTTDDNSSGNGPKYYEPPTKDGHIVSYGAPDFSHGHCIEDIASSPSNADSSSLSNFGPEDLEGLPNASVVRFETQESSAFNPPCADHSFSADSVSIHSTNISSITSYSSEEEGEYVIDHEGISVSPSGIVLTDIFASRNKSLSGLNSISDSSRDSVISPDPKLGSSRDGGTGTEGVSQAIAPSYVSQVMSKLSLTESDSDDGAITDDDIMKALEECDNSNDVTDFQPKATIESIKPRSISVDNTFKFDDDDHDDINV